MNTGKTTAFIELMKQNETSFLYVLPKITLAENIKNIILDHK